MKRLLIFLPPLLILILFGLSRYFLSPPISNHFPTTKRILALIIPHHLMVQDSILTALKTVKSRQSLPSSIVFLAPNHQELGSRAVNASTSALQYLPTLTILNPSYSQAILDQEHAVTDSLPLIHSVFPQVPVIPLVISQRLNQTEITQLATILHAHINNGGLIISSIDFSHYRSVEEADVFDAQTYQLIQKRDYESLLKLTNDHLDAPQILVVTLKALDLSKAFSVEKLSHTNSGKIIGNPLAPTTSHFTLIFQ